MRILPAIVATSLLFAACGDNDGDDRARAARAAPTTTGDGETTTTSTTSAMTGNDDGTTPPTVGDQADEQPRSGGAEDVLLSLEDMPSGWTVVPPDDDEPAEETSVCFGEAARDFEDDPDGQVEFQQDDLGPFVAAAVATYDSDDASGAALDELVRAFTGCDGYTEVQEDGTEITFSVSPMSFPNLGDETSAVRMRGETSFGPMVIDVAMTRINSTLIFLAHLAFGDVDTQLTERLQRTMAARA